jgi:hypothetical protein
MVIKLVIAILFLLFSVGVSHMLPRSGELEEKLKQLPGISTTGMNSVGCLINNEVWTATEIQADLSRFGNRFCLSLWIGDALQDHIVFIMETEDLKPGIYELNDPNSRYAYVRRQTSGCVFTSDEFYQGILMINEHDPARNVLAGTFEFLGYADDCQRALRVTNGRFDVTYSQH